MSCTTFRWHGTNQVCRGLLFFLYLLIEFVEQLARLKSK